MVKPGRRRRRRPGPGPRHGQAGRAGAPVPRGADQDHRGPRDPQHRVRQGAQLGRGGASSPHMDRGLQPVERPRDSDTTAGNERALPHPHLRVPDERARPERLAGLLEAEGLEPAGLDDADLVVLNTCAVRENADNKLYGTLGHLATTKASELTIAVGGCLAQEGPGLVLERAPWSTWCSGPTTCTACPPCCAGPATRAPPRPSSSTRCSGSLPPCRPAGPASGRPGWPSASAATTPATSASSPSCARQGTQPPGRRRGRRGPGARRRRRGRGQPARPERQLLRHRPARTASCSATCSGRWTGRGPGAAPLHQPQPQGLPRRRSRGHGRLPSPVRARPLPAAVGSTWVLRLTRRRRHRRRRRYLEILANLRAAIGGVAFSTDIIVGFPGETEADFADTLDLVGQARFDSASPSSTRHAPAPRPPPCPTRSLPRWSRTASSASSSPGARQPEANRALLGTEVELLVERSASKTNPTRMSGRTHQQALPLPGRNPPAGPAHPGGAR